MDRRLPSRRTRSRAHLPQSRSGGFRAGPLVAFLLIASFGILFAGCTSQIKGPNDAGMEEDTTFTADDIARFQQMTDGGGKAVSSQGGESGSEGATEGEGMAHVDLRPEGSPPVAALDPEIAAQYASVRAGGQNTPNAYRVINSFANVRGGPAIKAATVGKVNAGDVVTLIDFPNASWAKVKLAEGIEGYISSRYLAKLTTDSQLAADKKAFENVYYVNYGFVNVRAEPNSRSKKIGTIGGQEFVRPLSIGSEWARIMFEGKEAFVSVQFLARFEPQFIIRRMRYELPILQYRADQLGMIDALQTHADRLKQAGAKLLTLRDFFDLVLLQEKRDAPLPPKAVVITVTGVTPDNARQVSEALRSKGIPATLFIQTKDVGISGISEKLLQTLQANGFDIQSAGHTGDDLRGLTNAQVTLELQQSRMLLEEMTHRTVFAIAYPQGGVNDRVTEKAMEAGYLFGITEEPGTAIQRENFLRMPGTVVKASTTAEDVLGMVK